MASLVRNWIHRLDQIKEAADLRTAIRPPHLNPNMVSTHGMDQVNTAGPDPRPHPQPLDWEALEELAELRRKLTGRPHGADLAEEEREKIKTRIEELRQQLSNSPDDADLTYGLRKVPVTDDPKKVDLAPNDINKRSGEEYA